MRNAKRDDGEFRSGRSEKCQLRQYDSVERRFTLCMESVGKFTLFGGKGIYAGLKVYIYINIETMKKLGFCFLIYDVIHQEELWNLFFKNVSTDKYSIYIHYKTNIPLKYFEKFKLNTCIETKYCDISIVHAHNLLFKKALEDGCDKIISLSQSCIPLKSFDHIYDFLTKDDFCHFNICPHTQCFPNCNNLLRFYDKNTIQKSSNWFILNRKVCDIVVNYDKSKINHEYSGIYCPEEIYFITTVFKNNLTTEIITTPNLAKGATTFTNWSDMDYKYPSTHGLKNYTEISDEELRYLRDSPCLFGRKFHIKGLEDRIVF